MDWSTAGSKSWLWGCSHPCSLVLVLSVPCVNGNRTGTQYRDLDQRSKYWARIIPCVHPHKNVATFSTLPSPFLSCKVRAISSATKWGQTLGSQTHTLLAQWKTTHRFWSIKMRIWRINQGSDINWGAKIDQNILQHNSTLLIFWRITSQ